MTRGFTNEWQPGDPTDIDEKVQNMDRGAKMKTIYDPPSGWMYGFPRQFLPLPKECLKDTLIRDGYPEGDAEWAAKNTRFWEDASEFCVYCGAGIGKFRRTGEGTCPKCEDLK